MTKRNVVLQVLFLGLLAVSLSAFAYDEDEFTDYNPSDAEAQQAERLCADRAAGDVAYLRKTDGSEVPFLCPEDDDETVTAAQGTSETNEALAALSRFAERLWDWFVPSAQAERRPRFRPLRALISAVEAHNQAAQAACANVVCPPRSHCVASGNITTGVTGTSCVADAPTGGNDPWGTLGVTGLPGGLQVAPGRR